MRIVGLTSLSASKPSTTTHQSAFDVLINSSMNTKTIQNSFLRDSMVQTWIQVQPQIWNYRPNKRQKLFYL
jgi:hypothetical protein